MQVAGAGPTPPPSQSNPQLQVGTGLAPSSNTQGSCAKHVKGQPARSRGREEMTFSAERRLFKGCLGCSGFLEHTTFIYKGETGPHG